MPMTPSALATNLGVNEGDVDVILEQLGERRPELPDELAGFLRQLLDPQGERTTPPELYWPGSDQRPPRSFGLGGDDPTTP
jgi:hypothetical protein